jgi:hypothetical protein
MSKSVRQIVKEELNKQNLYERKVVSYAPPVPALPMENTEETIYGHAEKQFDSEVLLNKLRRSVQYRLFSISIGIAQIGLTLALSLIGLGWGLYDSWNYPLMPVPAMAGAGLLIGAGMGFFLGLVMEVILAKKLFGVKL